MNEAKIINRVGIIEAMALVDGFIWFVAGAFNAFFRIDINSGEVNYIGRIPGETFQKARLYSDIQQYEEKLIFVPMAADEIAIYDIKNNKFIKIKINDQNDTSNLYKQDYKFSKCIIYKEYAYFFCVSFPAIAKLDLKNYEMHYLVDWKKFFDGKKICEKKVYFRNAYEKEGKVYLPSCCDNQVVEFEMEQERFQHYEIGENGDNFSDIVFCENKICISKLNSSEILILEKNGWNKIGQINAGTDIPVSIEMKEWNNKIFYFPVNMCEIVIIEDSNKVRKHNLKSNLKSNTVYKVISDMSNCYFITEKEFHFVKFSMDDEKTEEKKLFIDDDTQNKIIQEFFLANIEISENFLNIKSWLTYIEKNEKNQHYNMNNNIGNEVWKHIKEG